MKTFYEITAQLSQGANAAVTELPAGTGLVAGAWDVRSFLNNAKSYVTDIGGGFLMLMGVVALIWGGWLLVKKLMGNQQQQGPGWGTIVMLVLVGGALSIGGLTLITTVGSGGQDTILDMGGGK